MSLPKAFTALALTGFCLSAAAAMDPHVESALVSVCKAGLSNNILRFENTMDEYRIKETRIFPRLMCNGESFYDFTASHGADRTARRIAHYLPGKVTIKDLAMTNKDELLYVSFNE